MTTYALCLEVDISECGISTNVVIKLNQMKQLSLIIKHRDDGATSSKVFIHIYKIHTHNSMKIHDAHVGRTGSAHWGGHYVIFDTIKYSQINWTFLAVRVVNSDQLCICGRPLRHTPFWDIGSFPLWDIGPCPLWGIGSCLSLGYWAMSPNNGWLSLTPRGQENSNS